MSGSASGCACCFVALVTGILPAPAHLAGAAGFQHASSLCARSVLPLVLPPSCLLRMSTEREEEKRCRYMREREAREKKLLSTQVDMKALFGREDATDYEEKDRHFRIRNAMLDPTADSDWADEALMHADSEQEQQAGKGVEEV